MNSYAKRRNPLNLYRQVEAGYQPKLKVTLFVFFAVCYTAFLYNSGGAKQFADPDSTDTIMSQVVSTNTARKLRVTTWNIAAINNNPFEYWITYDEDPEYKRIMEKVEGFIENPGHKDIPVKEVFHEQMFTNLEKRMTEVGMNNVRSYWEDDFKNRKIVSNFLKDSSLGNKRLISMLDRITNTINVVGSNEPICRPTVINMYDGDLGSMEKWWSAWESFLFDKRLLIKKENEESMLPCEMLQQIKKSKYPAITDAEEKDSIPLQTLCGAIFDAILVHMMNTLSTPDVWQRLKRTMVEALNKKKVPNTLALLNKVYIDSDIITLQEVSSFLIDQAKDGPLGQTFWIYAPGDMDAVRDQNSVIMLNKLTFPEGMTSEITQLVVASFPKGESVKKVPVAAGDINALTAKDRYGVQYVIVSFHGDTNGLATIPVNDAISKTMANNAELTDNKLIFGLDANTYENGLIGKKQDVLEWGENYRNHGMTSCWGEVPQKSNYTTFNARTFLQPQLNKACKSTEKREKGDVNPKDFILFKKRDFSVVETLKDNTGDKRYIEDMAFPTLQFPSDHAVLSTILSFK